MVSEKAYLPRRILGMVLSVSLTGAIVVGAGVAAVTGTSVLAARNAAEVGPPPAPATSVRAMTIGFQPTYQVERRFSGSFEAAQEAALAFELGGTVVDVLVDEGDAVAKGDLLARLDTRLLEQERARLVASRAGLEADAELARRTNARQQELKDRGFATAQRVDDTSLGLMRVEAAIAEITAAIEAVDVQLSKSELRAPYDGQISARLVDVGAVGAQGAPVLQLIEEATYRFRVGLAPDLAEALSLGDIALIDLGDRRIEAELTHIAPRLDEATRARTAFFTPVDARAAPAGQTGEAILRQTIDAGFDGAWVPLDALRQGPRGSWTVLTLEGVDSPAKVELAAVEIIHVDTGKAFVRGTFGSDTRLIESGAHRVVPGEVVEVLSGDEVLSWAR